MLTQSNIHLKRRSMKTKYLLIVSAVTVSGLLTFNSCKKDDDKTVTKADAVAIAKIDANADVAYNEIYSITENILSDRESNSYPTDAKKNASLTSGFTVTIDKSGDVVNFPKTITIVFNNYISNGIKKNGTIRITQSAKIREANAVRTVTLENFVLNDTIQLEGKKTITNKGLVSEKPSIQVKLENGKISFNNNTYITRNFTRTITWSEGSDTPFNIFDDKYTFDQTAQGSSKSGLNYSTKTTVPLELKIGELCIKKGKIEINVEGKKTVYLDFTRTSCLNKVKLTLDGDTEEISTL